MIVDHLVIGMGEVGTALLEVLPPGAAGRDVESKGRHHAEILHICFPWSADFLSDVLLYEQVYTPRLVVVHSTVPIGTCDPQGWVHSPIRGRHPELVESIRTFRKIFGGERAEEAATPFRDLGIPTVTTDLAATTEAGKLWELVQFGIQVKVEQAIHEHATSLGLDPEWVYRWFAATYNEGYIDLGDNHFTRPILEHMPGPIGGHCIRQNARLLDHPLARLVRQVDEWFT